MASLAQLVFFVCIFCQAVFPKEYEVYNDTDSVGYNYTDPADRIWKCHQEFRNCLSIPTDSFSPFVEGKPFPVFTEETIDGACRYFKESMTCEYSTAKIPGCEDILGTDREMYIAETLVQRACFGQGRVDLLSLLNCSNKVEVQLQFLWTFANFEGFLQASRNCGSNDTRGEEVCRQMTRAVDSCASFVNSKCGSEDFDTLKRLLQLFGDIEDMIFNTISSQGSQYSCNFLRYLI